MATESKDFVIAFRAKAPALVWYRRVKNAGNAKSSNRIF